MERLQGRGMFDGKALEGRVFPWGVLVYNFLVYNFKLNSTKGSAVLGRVKLTNRSRPRMGNSGKHNQNTENLKSFSAEPDDQGE
jgi:hypothetical protein